MVQLPDCLLSFSIENYKGIKHAECDGLADANWVFLTGENGSGKTSVLQAVSNTISSGSSQLPLEMKFLFGKISYTDVQFRESFKTINSKIKLNSEIDDITNQALAKNISIYGPIRLNIQAEETKNEISRKSQTAYGLFHSDGILLNIEYDFLLWKLEKDSKFETMKSIFKTIIPTLDDVILEGRTIKYIQKDASGFTYEPVT